VFSFSKVAILIGLVLVFVGYRWGKRKTLERLQPPSVQAPPPPPHAAAPRQTSWLSVKVLLIIVILLLCVAILSSLNLRA